MKNKKNNLWLALILITAILLFAIFGLGEDLKGAKDMRFGIDIRGGAEAIFEPVRITEKPSAADLEAARNVMESRLDAKNILDREVTIDKSEGNIIVRFPWKSDEKKFNPEEAIAELGETARLTFQDMEGNVLVEGRNVVNSTMIRNQENGEYEVQLQFDKQGAADFEAATEKMIGKSMGIYMDEQLISNPVVQEKIAGGEAVINGMRSDEEARTLSEKINAGALPFSLTTTNYNTISPSLGSNALKAMLMASAVAFVLVCFFMITYYKLPGAISCLTLVFQMSLQLLALSLLQYTLTLPGIAGLILSVGMAVDANIITSERISEELKKGCTIRQAVKNGYKKAFSSVLDGNITSAVVAVILMIFGSGSMLSFGYTLFTGVLINVLAGVGISKIMLNAIIQYKAFDKTSMFRLKKDKKILPFSSKRKLILLFTVGIVIAGTAGSAVNGIKLDTQFTGGVILKYSYNGTIDSELIDRKIQDILDRPVNVQISKDAISGQEKLAITLAGNKGISPMQQKEVTDTLNTIGETTYQLSQTFAVEPYIGQKALENSVIAIVLSTIFIVLYIWIRFSILSGLSAGISAVLALLHDVLMVLFVFGIFKIPLNDAFVAVTLTIIGYSINDTIVLYDRIRENMQLDTEKKEKIAMLVDRSITETIGRSVNTAFTTVLCVLIVFIFAVVYNIESIKVFSLPLLVGMICGCYSSVCIAGPIWVTWKEYRQKKEVCGK